MKKVRPPFAHLVTQSPQAARQGASRDYGEEPGGGGECRAPVASLPGREMKDQCPGAQRPRGGARRAAPPDPGRGAPWEAGWEGPRRAPPAPPRGPRRFRLPRGRPGSQDEPPGLCVAGSLGAPSHTLCT
ncbi:hypothetical protein R6Z07F_007005 [Ovis aries]